MGKEQKGDLRAEVGLLSGAEKLENMYGMERRNQEGGEERGLRSLRSC